MSLVPLRVIAQHHTRAPGEPNFSTQVVGALKRIGADTDLVEGAGAAAVENRAQDARLIGGRRRGRTLMVGSSSETLHPPAAVRLGTRDAG